MHLVATRANSIFAVICIKQDLPIVKGESQQVSFLFLKKGKVDFYRFLQYQIKINKRPKVWGKTMAAGLNKHAIIRGIRYKPNFLFLENK